MSIKNTFEFLTPASASYVGAVHDYVLITENHQLLDKRTWDKFIEVFTENSDDAKNLIGAADIKRIGSVGHRIQPVVKGIFYGFRLFRRQRVVVQVPLADPLQLIRLFFVRADKHAHLRLSILSHNPCSFLALQIPACHHDFSLLKTFRLTSDHSLF